MIAANVTDAKTVYGERESSPVYPNSLKQDDKSCPLAPWLPGIFKIALGVRPLRMRINGQMLPHTDRG